MNSIKCPDCGLVNFSTSDACKRCGQVLNSEGGPNPSSEPGSHYWKPMAQPKPQPLFSGGVVFLGGLLIVTAILFLIQQMGHPLDPDTAKGIGGLFGLIGLLFIVVTHIWLLIRIFEQSIGWGLASIFIPLAMLAAVGQFWHKTRRSFIGHVISVGILFAGIGIGV